VSIPNRREFTQNVAAGSLALAAAPPLLRAVEGPTPEKQRPKSCILVWLDGAPSTFDMWDLKPRSTWGASPFKQIETAGEMKICEHLPRIAKVMDRLSIIRSMSTREAAHERGAYFMQTGFYPIPNVTHPTAGSVISHTLRERHVLKEVPGYLSIDGPAESGGYLGQQFAPLLIRSKTPSARDTRLGEAATETSVAAELLELLNDEFSTDRNQRLKNFRIARDEARRFYQSEVAEALNIDDEHDDTRARYGDDRFGRASLLARRLVQRGVPFVRLQFPKSWDIRDRFFDTLRCDLLPTLDRGISALVHDLTERMLLDRVVLVVMGSCGRSPRIRNGHREPWARTWSLLIGGGGLKSGIAVGETDKTGAHLLTRAYSAPHLWATVLKALNIPLDTEHRDQHGRPRKIVGGAWPIRELAS